MVQLRKEAVGVLARGRQTWKGKVAGGIPVPEAASGRSRTLWQSGVASPLHGLTEQHDDLLLHVVLPGGLHRHHG